MKWKNIPPHYQVVTTGDGSLTLHSENFDESCHSKAGAMEETREIYFEGTQLLSAFQERETVNLLEVGFGAGIGALCLFSLMQEHQLEKTRIQYTSLELDPALIQFFTDNNPQFSSVENDIGFGLQSDSLDIRVLIGDARETINRLLNDQRESFHILFQDAFSPRKNPRLWTSQWFFDLYQVSHPSARMSTYSATSAIRKSMLKAGWKVANRAGFQHKKSATIASKSGQSDPELLKKLERSPACTLTDENAQDYRLGKI